MQHSGAAYLQRSDPTTAEPTAGAASARLRPQIMAVTADELAELEERLLAKLQQPSRVEEVDLPAAEYFRVTCVTTSLLVYVCVSMIISICTTGIYGALSQIEFLLWPLCWTALWGLLIYGTIDSDAAGRRAVLILRVWSIPLIFIAPTMYWTSGLKGEAALMLFTFSVNAIFFPWLGNATRVLLRARYQGALTARAQHYTNRALKLAGFQIVLLVAAVAQGLHGKETFGRIYATMVFSVTLSLLYMYMTAIFDACGVDASAAAKLRLAPMQAAAVACCGAVTLSGLAGYVPNPLPEITLRITLPIGTWWRSSDGPANRPRPWSYSRCFPATTSPWFSSAD